MIDATFNGLDLLGVILAGALMVIGIGWGNE